jgi:membrane associated rhomboid family serine protease
MVKCDHCDDEIDYLPFICRYCGKSYCKTHRIPENHSCSFEFKNDPYKVKAEKNTKSARIYTDYPAESYEKPKKRVRIRQPRIRNRSRPQVTTLLGMQAKPYATYGIMIGNGVMFAISVMLSFIQPSLQDLVYLSASDIPNFYLWTIFTSIFQSVGPITGGIDLFLDFLYLFIKVFMLFFIGRMIEARWGWRTLIKLYLISGLFSSLAIILLHWGSTFIYTSPDYSLNGADLALDYQYISSWGATMGLIAFYAFLFPQQQVTMFLYFIPIRVKMKNLVLILIGIQAVYGLVNILMFSFSPIIQSGVDSFLRYPSFPQNFGGIAGILGAWIVFRSVRRNY